MTRFSSAALLLLVVVLGCSKTTPEPEKDPTTTPPPATTSSSVATPKSSSATSGSAPTGAAAAIGPDDIGYEAPKAWTSVANPNAFRKATFKVPKTAGDTEDAELTVSSASGGVDQNVKRWAGQFGSAEPKTTPRTVNGLKVTIVEIKGTFSSGPGMMGGPSTPKDKWMLLGAVVDSGERQHFFKMTGPEKTVNAARSDFDAFVATFRGK